jgi:hypothetical protein
MILSQVPCRSFPAFVLSRKDWWRNESHSNYRLACKMEYVYICPTIFNPSDIKIQNTIFDK